ncbi:hypothetical protein [Bacillus sp. OTU530]
MKNNIEYKIKVEPAEPDPKTGEVPTFEDLLNSDEFKEIVKKIIFS